jgi:hypothetical protein
VVISVRITQLWPPVSLSLDTKRRHAQADVSQQPTRCDYSGILRPKDLSSPTSQVLRYMEIYWLLGLVLFLCIKTR